MTKFGLRRTNVRRAMILLVITAIVALTSFVVSANDGDCEVTNITYDMVDTREHSAQIYDDTLILVDNGVIFLYDLRNIEWSEYDNQFTIPVVGSYRTDTTYAEQFSVSFAVSSSSGEEEDDVDGYILVGYPTGASLIPFSEQNGFYSELWTMEWFEGIVIQRYDTIYVRWTPWLVSNQPAESENMALISLGNISQLEEPISPERDTRNTGALSVSVNIHGVDGNNDPITSVVDIPWAESLGTIDYDTFASEAQIVQTNFGILVCTLE